MEHGRGIGITELLHGHVEGPVIVLFALVTQLGDVWLLTLLGGVLYVAGDSVPRWGIDRRRGLFVFALALVYVTLIGVLKHVFMLPRPPGAGEAPAVQWLPPMVAVVFDNIATADGSGFPSGHALGSTMVWGGLALVVDRGPPWKRFGVAGTVVVLVAISRLVLGVHYAVDVAVGVVLGLVVLAALYLVSDRASTPELVLLVAVTVGTLGVVVDVAFESAAAVGSAVGAWLVWHEVADATPAQPTSRREVVAGTVVLVLAGGLFSVIYVLDLSSLFGFAGAALMAGGTVVAPLLGSRLA